MRPAVVRLVVAAVLFAGWIGFLAYLAVTSSRPVVLSRPQFLVSTYDVIADVGETPGPVTVREVVWPKGAKPANPIEVSTDLSKCKNWHGPGLYILPLVKQDNKTYRVAPIPPSPGYRGETTLEVNAPAGATSIAVVSTAGINAGDWLRIGKGAAIEANMVSTVTNGTTLELSQPLVNAHSSGSPVAWPLRIYPLTPETQRELDDILKIEGLK